jgi:putative DNA primase/helicase
VQKQTEREITSLMILDTTTAIALNALLKGMPSTAITLPNGETPEWQKQLVNAVLAVEPAARLKTFRQAIADHPHTSAIEADVFQADRLPTDPRTLHLTDTGNAEMLALLYGQRVRYDHMQGRWLIWSDHRWKPDADGEIFRIAIDTVRERMKLAMTFTGEEQKDKRDAMLKWGMTSEGKFKLSAAVEIAARLHPITDSGQYWDLEPLLLGCANGVIDLSNGDFRSGSPSDRITQSTSIEYDPAATAPRWNHFLYEIFNGDDELVKFIQRAVGYSITGDTREQCMFFCWGSGANGKSTFLDVLRWILGDYAANTPFSTFDLSRQTSIPNDLAALYRARMVTASETNESRRMNEGRVKAMTGDAALTARFMHREFFTFRPLFKIWLAMNHKPVITGTDDGIWRRIRLIPFTVSFKDRADKTLAEKLKNELPGILTWAVQGCLSWQALGLGMVDAIQNATDSYRLESDVLAQFIDEALVVNPKAKTHAGDLYKHYDQWCKSTGHEALNSTNFGRRMTERGYMKEKQSGSKYYIGIGLPIEHGIFKDSQDG